MNEEIMFESRDDFRKWLIKNHNNSNGIWVVFGKAGKLKTIKQDEALEEALCFGWIDGQFNSIDEEKYLKRFTPRRKDSKWSEKNKNLVNVLIDTGRMTEYGMAVIEQAKKNGNWDTPKVEPITDEQIAVLLSALSGAELALANFMKMPISVKRTYTALYLDAKKEATRKKRLDKIIERLNENKKPM